MRFEKTKIQHFLLTSFQHLGIYYFGGISYENWWSTNLCKYNPFVFGNKLTFTR